MLDRPAALRLLQAEIGGRILGDRLFPIAPCLSALRPLEPGADLLRRWHVVHTEPQRESAVAEAVRGLKLDVYAPQELKKVRLSAARHRTVMRPLLPGYVFAGFDAGAELWEPISRLRGVVRLIMFDLRPVPVLGAVIDYIRRREASEGRQCDEIVGLEVGKMVRMIEPVSFSGLFGFVARVDNGKRQVCVELDIFGRKTPLWVAPENVEAV